ncbi:hypothetical protein [Cryobacterium psychrophilum]|uniref:Uncharacterized protein n=1 Tax=Cryobacterium psychrophilum TaxID=41988 RepID=A0A4Y8KSE1_9MICO|nr:hypothetical protein [Cryobacterium psychrophilum]TDW29611.1 hypothetical protein EDD25_1321 [Cryobacterium psychrophilum]TFD81737.1 hypothetical protein E3T53_01685 [Cryobacterium psychrophilum]
MTIWTEPLPSPRDGWRRSPVRLSGGLLLVCLGVGATSLSSTYSLWFLAIGPLVQGIGWMLLPGPLWRRLVVLFPCLLAGVILLGGVDFVGAFTILLGGWLLVRRRPLATYVTILLPVMASVGVKTELSHYDQNLLALLLGTIATVAGAWLSVWMENWLRTRTELRTVTG